MDCLFKESFRWDQKSPAFHGNGIKFSNEKIFKRQNDFYKNSVENSSYYSLFFNSKTHSNINSSILSYIVGGFVGSKSQMNNNKKNSFSYDLSAVISNVLNPWKSENLKTSRKKNVNSSYGVPSIMHQGSFNKCSSSSENCESKCKKNCFFDMYNLEYLFALPLKNLVEHENSVLDFNKNFNESDFKKNNNNLNNMRTCDKNYMNCSKKITQESSLEDSTIDLDCKFHFKNKMNNKTKNNFKKIKKKSVKSKVTIDKEKPNSKLKMSTSNLLECNGPKNSMPSESLMNVSNENHRSSTKFSNDCWASERLRKQSECSNESTDSDNFIVFEDHLDESDTLKNSKTPCIKDIFDGDIENASDKDSEEENYTDSDSDNYDSNDSNDDDDEEDDDCDEDKTEEEEADENDIENLMHNDCNKNNYYDEHDFCSISKNVSLANDNWLNIYQYDTEKTKSLKKVKFSDKIIINKMVTWDYAYRMARVGPWEQLARDRVRFHERISRLSLIISPILKLEHRNEIYKKLHS